MVLIVFFVVLLLSFAIFLLYRKNKVDNGTIKTYYFRRFLRNKAQIEKYIDELTKIIDTYNCGKDYFSDVLTLNDYLTDLQHEYKKSYIDFNVSILKRSNLKDKHKKFYAKMLIKQSEKLYFVETDLIKINEKYNS